MLLGFLFLLSLSESTTVFKSTPMGFTTSMETKMTTEEKLPHLQLAATPDYPVAEGQRVHLHCSAFPSSAVAMWSWQRLQNQTWKEVAVGREVTLTEPQQSGTYRCHAESRLSQKSVSQNHTVYIIAVPATVGEKLGIAAFVLSLLILICIITGLLHLGWQRFGDTRSTSTDTVKGALGSEVTSKGSYPQASCDGDVYINYTSNNHSYSDLDPTNMSTDNVYSSLS